MEERAASVFDPACPTRRVLDRVADKWTALVIRILAQRGTQRYGQLRQQVGGVSQKMLTQTLRHLERDGLVERTQYPTIPPKVEYSLTPLGHDLAKPLGALCDWAEQHIGSIETAQTRYDAAIDPQPPETERDPGIR